MLLLVTCLGWSCTDQDNPIALTSIPAGKVYVGSDSGECLAISWPCDTEVDSVWTVFYGSDYRFQAHGERVLFSHYLDSNSKRQYWASETSTRLGRVRSGFRSGDGACGIWSEAIDNDTSVVRIYRGDVNYLYRDTPNARYTLLEDEEQYPIAYVEEDGSVRHRDFFSFHNRNQPRPDGLVAIRSTYYVGGYYLPVNFSAAALDTLTALPEDDRPYLDDSILDDSICSGDVRDSTPQPQSRSAGISEQTEQTEQIDRPALMAFYAATGGGSNWTGHNWGSDEPIGTWEGVTTNAGGRVIRLVLRNGLTGSIPSALGQLTNLTTLDLHRNGLTGSIPSFGQLTNLKELRLSDNGLTGSIPSFGQLTNLEILALDRNELTGSIPSFGQLTNLKELYLYSNELTGSIPSALGQLTNLYLLLLAGNQLSGCIPPSLYTISNNDLDRLGLSVCQ